MLFNLLFVECTVWSDDIIYIKHSLKIAWGMKLTVISCNVDFYDQTTNALSLILSTVSP